MRLVCPCVPLMPCVPLNALGPDLCVHVSKGRKPTQRQFGRGPHQGPRNKTPCACLRRGPTGPAKGILPSDFGAKFCLGRLVPIRPCQIFLPVFSLFLQPASIQLLPSSLHPDQRRRPGCSDQLSEGTNASQDEPGPIPRCSIPAAISPKQMTGQLWWQGQFHCVGPASLPSLWDSLLPEPVSWGNPAPAPQVMVPLRRLLACDLSRQLVIIFFLKGPWLV